MSYISTSTLSRFLNRIIEDISLEDQLINIYSVSASSRTKLGLFLLPFRIHVVALPKPGIASRKERFCPLSPYLKLQGSELAKLVFFGGNVRSVRTTSIVSYWAPSLVPASTVAGPMFTSETHERDCHDPLRVYNAHDRGDRLKNHLMSKALINRTNLAFLMRSSPPRYWSVR